MSRVGGQLGFIEPQLLTSVDQPPRGDKWLHEIKHDGYRSLFVVLEGTVMMAKVRSHFPVMGFRQFSQSPVRPKGDPSFMAIV
jgi:hypothetical protein